MIHSTTTKQNGSDFPHGYNRCIRDAMDLCGVDLQRLSEILGIDEDKCRRYLDHEMIILKKMSWLAKIFKLTHEDPAPRFASLNEWEMYIRQEITDRGPEWLAEPPIIEGSSRYYHQLYNQFRRNRQKEAADE